MPSKPPALHVSRYVLGGGTLWVRALLYVWDPNWARWDPVDPSSSLRGTQIGFGGTRWDPALLYVGPYTPFGFYNAN